MPPKKTAAKRGSAAKSKATRAKNAAPRKAPAKRKPTTPRAAPKRASAKREAPAFGRAGTAGKAEGDAATRAWIAQVKPEHREIVEKLDALIGRVVPDVKRAIKWSTPLYGRPGRGFFASVASFKNYVSLGFFAGTDLDPPPPMGEGKGLRRVNVRDLSEYDEKQFRAWIKQAAALPGWGTV